MKFVVLAVSTVTSINLAYGNQEHPFSNYPRVGENIFVEREDLFRRYEGAPPTLTREEADDGISRVRLGTVTVTPDEEAVVEVVTYPLSTSYELRVPVSGALFHEFTYTQGDRGKLLFTGRGTVFEFAGVGLCQGSATRKYDLASGKLVEIAQPFLYLNEQTVLLADIRIFSSPSLLGSPVAHLQKAASVTVIGALPRTEKFLIKTPLGLTGWLNDSRTRNALGLMGCN